MKYYYELNVDEHVWDIYDPNKNYFCSVFSKHEAETLLQLLNKQNFIYCCIYKQDKHMGG